MPYRVNGQYIMEGLASSFLFMMGGLGFVILDQTNKPLMPKYVLFYQLNCYRYQTLCLKLSQIAFNNIKEVTLSLNYLLVAG